MKMSLHLKISVLAFIAFIPFAQGQTQTDLTMHAGDRFAKADRELNSVYQKILKSYAAQPVVIKNLKAAQRLWVQLRDAELAAKYPAGTDGGSAEPMCKAIYLESLTRERIKFLNVWLTGIPEGDVCTGAVKTRL